MERRKSIVSTLLIVLLAFLDSAHGWNYWNIFFKSPKTPNFDVLVFTQHWPQTVCFQWKEKDDSNICTLPDNDEWSIHGIWPTQYHTMGPQFCNDSLPFNRSALAPLRDELISKWTDIEEGKESYDFWRHEWNKHGTCAATLESLNSEYKYFRKGLDLLDIYEMKNLLAKARIMPGGEYEVRDIFQAIQKILGVNAQIMGLQSPKTKEWYLFEIRICFDKSLQLTDCDGIIGYPSNCNPTQKLLYPGVVPTNYHVVQI